jgi:YidC/Oxa1 family membrane protein insertase
VFDLIATVLAWFYSIIPNYAAAIAMMTILIMLLLTPLTLKSTKSMLEMQRIQPEMKRIQQEHRGDRQAMNEAMMALYKEHGVNPLGGCLPLLIQMPIWIVMFRVLRGITYKPAGSVFFKPKYLDHSTQLYQDLSHSAQMKAFGLNLAESAALALKHSFVTALPYLVLVAVVVVTYFIQQRQITARTKNKPIADTPQAAQQQMIMKIFPFFSGLFAFIVPASLAWYFLVQNVFRIGQQAYITKRFYHEHPDAVAEPTIKAPPARPDRKASAPKGGQKGTKASPPKAQPGRAAPPPKTTATPPAAGSNPKGKPTPTRPTPSANGNRRQVPKPPPRPSGSTGKPPARPRPQQKKKP